MLCEVLFKSTHPELYVQPRRWLESLLARIAADSFSEELILTRRSSGIWLCMHERMHAPTHARARAYTYTCTHSCNYTMSFISTTVAGANTHTRTHACTHSRTQDLKCLAHYLRLFFFFWCSFSIFYCFFLLLFLLILFFFSVTGLPFCFIAILRAELSLENRVLQLMPLAFKRLLELVCIIQWLLLLSNDYYYYYYFYYFYYPMIIIFIICFWTE